MTSIFRSPEAKAMLDGWYEKFLARVPRPTERRVVQTRLGETQVRVGGPVDGPALVLLHGAMASSAHVLLELSPLLEHFRVYAVDVIGQSVKSADVRPRVDNDEYGHWLGEVFDGLGLARAHMVGVSWGGFVALRFAVVAGARIERLVLLAPAGLVNGPAWSGLTKVGLPMLWYRLFPTRRRLEGFVEHLLTTKDDDWVPFLGDAVRSYALGMQVPMLAKPEELATFVAPTFVFGAGRDYSFPGAALVARAAVLFPALAGTEVIANSHHCPPTTDPFRRWLASRIQSFLLGKEASAAVEFS
jgi:2-hydroxy-6-oxonona-2,4-dienedioate hydrolase